MMKQAAEQHQLRITDGSNVSTDLVAPTLLEQAASATEFLNCHRWRLSPHEFLLRSIAERSALVLTTANKWLNERIQNHQIGLAFTDGATCNAEVGDISDNGGIRVSHIDISLGCISRVLGCANRLLLLIHDNFSGDYVTYGEPIDIELQWDPVNDPLGTLTMIDEPDLEPSVQAALDAMLLIYFHEATHSIAAHLNFPVLRDRSHTDYNQYRRAAESEADYGGAWLFMEFMKSHSTEDGGSPFDPASAVHRLALAGLCHYTTFQLELRPEDTNELYHLPNVRMRCSFDGAYEWWSAAMGSDHKFSELINSTLGQIPVELLFPKSFPGWIDLGSEAAALDEEIYATQTKALTAEIQAYTKGKRTFVWRPTVEAGPNNARK